MSDMRERFHAVSSRHFSGTLCDRYTIRMTDEEEWKPHLDRLLERSFDRHNINFDAVLSPAEKQATKELDEHLATNPLVHRVLFEENDQVVGCYQGMQEGNARYYMMFSIIDPAHQGRGLYSQFLPRLMAAVEELGFMQIYSRHHADNNQVLVPKLKAGFVISAFEISSGYGLLVNLRYYFNPTLRQLHSYRVDAAVHSAALRSRAIVNEKE